MYVTVKDACNLPGENMADCSANANEYCYCLVVCRRVYILDWMLRLIVTHPGPSTEAFVEPKRTS